MSKKDPARRGQEGLVFIIEQVLDEVQVARVFAHLVVQENRVADAGLADFDETETGRLAQISHIVPSPRENFLRYA